MSERERHLWAWGWDDRFMDETSRRGFAEQVGPIIGLEGLGPLPIGAFDPNGLPPPRISAPKGALDPILGADPRERALHAHGRSYRDQLRGSRGDFSSAPDLVAKPKNAEDVERILEWCTRHQIAVIPFGGGTSVVGGVEPDVPPRYAGVVSLDMRAMERVLHIDPLSRLARIEAGATGPGLEAKLAERGFTLRFYPQSFEFSTLGGWIATRAGGHFATLYTHIDDLVASIRMITPAGLLETPPLPASGAGPSADRFMLGSEGALGVITEATVRIQERPRFRAKASVFFDRFEDGVTAARALAQSGLHPANCRLLSAEEALLFQVTGERKSVLLVAFESSDHALDAWIDRAIALAEESGGRCPNGPKRSDREESAELWKSAFVEAPYLQSALVTLGVVADTFETACTWSTFDRLHAEVIGRVTDAMARVAGGGRIFCRFTHVYPDGPAPYYTFIAKAKPGAELEQWAEIKQAASEALLAHGATITHHHAVGRIHRPWYERQTSPRFLEVLKAAKQTLDPGRILNPGALIGG